MVLAISARACAAAAFVLAATSPTANAADLAAVGRQYARMAFTMYSDALRSARVLQQTIEAFVEAPDAARFAAARSAWIEAHKTYSLTEAFRFGNPNVDAWEGKVNAWPIDEGFIDYVRDDYVFDLGNPHAQQNLVASDAPLDTGTLRLQHERGGLEPNVSIGFHAIEFLLWGQDSDPAYAQPGQRAYTDYVRGGPSAGCTHGHCERRATYLRLLANLLVFDLREMVRDWRPGYGGYADRYASLDPAEQVRRIFEGLGTLSAGELAGERLQVALIAHSQEDEQSCFSDTTHWGILYNLRGISSLYTGGLSPATGSPSGEKRTDRDSLGGTSLAGLVDARDPSVGALVRARLDLALVSARRLADAAEAGQPFDLQIAASNLAGRRRVQELIEHLSALAEAFESAAASLGLSVVAGSARSTEFQEPVHRHRRARPDSSPRRIRSEGTPRP